MCDMCSRTELDKYRIDRIYEAHKPLLATVDWVDNSVDCWIECINDDGEKIRLVPDMTGWQDGRREVMVMNCVTGVNTKLFFRCESNGDYFTHNATRQEDIEAVMYKIPWAVMDWAASKAH